jgi:hypothetical protein
MVQEKVFRFNVWYNFAMSEATKEGAHPGKQPGNLAGIKYSGESAPLAPLRKRGVRGSGMTGQGLLDEPEPATVLPGVTTSAPDITSVEPSQSSESNVTEPIASGQTELIPRKLKFKRGTRLYKVVHDSEGRIIIPRTPAQADDFFDRKLTVPTYLVISVEYLEIGKRGGTITKKVGQSDYGAFTVVLFPVPSGSGKVAMEERLVSYTTRSSKKEL